MHLVPRYRQKLAPRALRPGTAGVGRRPALQRPLPRAPQRAARAGLRRAAAQPRRAAVRPAAGPHQAAVGAQSRRGPRGRPLRDHLEDPPRARRRRQRRRHHLGPLRHLARRRAVGGRGQRLGAAPGADATPSCWPRRCSSARRCRPRAPAACARSRARRARSSGRRANGSSASARWPGPGSARRRPRPSTCRSARTGATRGSTPRSARFKAIKNALGGTLNDVVLSAVVARARAVPAPPRRSRPRGSCSRRWFRCPCAPTTQRGALGNRVAAMWAPLPVGVTDPEAVLRPRSPRRCAGSRSPARPSAPWR